MTTFKPVVSRAAVADMGSVLVSCGSLKGGGPALTLTCITLVFLRMVSGGGSCWKTTPSAHSPVCLLSISFSTNPACSARVLASGSFSSVSLGTLTETGVLVGVGVIVTVNVGVFVGGGLVGVGVGVGMMGVGVGLGTTPQSPLKILQTEPPPNQMPIIMSTASP